LLSRAVDERGSDIHMEPSTDGLTVRFQVDGRLRARFRLDTGPCVGTGGGLAKSGKEIQDSKAAPQHGQLGADIRSYQEGRSCEKIIDAAIKKIYLTAERPDVAAVVEEVNLQ
jgi:hypothetical protein